MFVQEDHLYPLMCLLHYSVPPGLKFLLSVIAHLHYHSARKTAELAYLYLVELPQGFQMLQKQCCLAKARPQILPEVLS